MDKFRTSSAYSKLKRYIPKRVKEYISRKLPAAANKKNGDRMDLITADIFVKAEGRVTKARGKKMVFSPHRLFTYDNSPEEKKCLRLLADYLASKGEIAVYGSGRLFRYLLEEAPYLRQAIRHIIEDDESLQGTVIEGIQVISPEELPYSIRTVLLCETLTIKRWSMAKKLRYGVQAVSPEILAEIGRKHVPARAWVPACGNIYPIDVPEIDVRPGLDMLLVDCPSRNMAFMPNGIAYVNNALKKAGVRFQTMDLDIIAYHRFHVYRIFDASDAVRTPAGKRLPEDPWLAENYELWQKQDTVEFFRPEIDETVRAIVKARPKVVGFSIQACNVKFAREVAKEVKAQLPETIILAGGYSCYQPFIGRLAFPEADYMIIGEADLIVGDLVRRLASGERPTGLPGVITKYDAPDAIFKPGPMPKDLDAIEMPRYEWYGIDVYRNYNHYQLTPIIASRGCRWSKCKFCAERFFWRIRSPKNVVDEFEYLASQGCDLFMFNESDLNGMPEALIEICDEIIRRKLTVKLTGQLRIHKNSDKAFFDKLKAAGFVSLRFGVDAWSENTLRLQMKGYTLDMISQNLKDCSKAGIYTEVNIVLGVPGETDEDITESIDLIAKNKPYIGRVANINPLMLMSGSVYWEEPENYGISFRGDKSEIVKQHQHMVPDSLWYSEGPYIDEKVRRARFERVVLELHKLGFDVGPFAAQVIKDVLDGKGAGRSARPDAASDDGPKEDEIINSAQNPDNEKLDIVRFDGSYWCIDPATKDRAQDATDADITGVKRDNPANIRLITEGFHGYNIIKAEGVFYGIKQGHAFDINMAERGAYEAGACFKGCTVKGVEESIAGFAQSTRFQGI